MRGNGPSLGNELPRLTRPERSFARRVLRLAQEGSVASTAQVLNRDGPAATLYYGALMLLGMVTGTCGLLAVAAIFVSAFTASGGLYRLVVGVSLASLALCPRRPGR